MKLSSTLIALAAQSNALKQEEIDQFGCREGTYYGYSLPTASRGRHFEWRHKLLIFSQKYNDALIEDTKLL